MKRLSHSLVWPRAFDGYQPDEAGAAVLTSSERDADIVGEYRQTEGEEKEESEVRERERDQKESQASKPKRCASRLCRRRRCCCRCSSSSSPSPSSSQDRGRAYRIDVAWSDFSRPIVGLRSGARLRRS